MSKKALLQITSKFLYPAIPSREAMDDELMFFRPVYLTDGARSVLPDCAHAEVQNALINITPIATTCSCSSVVRNTCT